jgi:uncharacterized protein (TIGR03067 family)
MGYPLEMKRRLLFAAALFGWILEPGAQADDLQALNGKWKVQSVEAGGKLVESEDLKELVVTITGDRYELTTKDGPDRGLLKLDETRQPKTMDATDTEGSDAGKVIKAIYEISGDILRVCYALQGDERPAEFATKQDIPLLLITYRREK